MKKRRPFVRNEAVLVAVTQDFKMNVEFEAEMKHAPLGRSIA